MNRIPYHIQRCESRTGEDFTGWDSAFRCDYMGAAEFEFGALARSLRRVVAQTYTMQDANPDRARDGRVLYSVCGSAEDHNAVARFIPGLISRKMRTKEATYLAEMMGAGHRFETIDVWWDIDNDWFLALGEKAAKRVLKTIDRQRVKWAETKGETNHG